MKQSFPVKVQVFGLVVPQHPAPGTMINTRLYPEIRTSRAVAETVTALPVSRFPPTGRRRSWLLLQGVAAQVLVQACPSPAAKPSRKSRAIHRSAAALEVIDGGFALRVAFQCLAVKSAAAVSSGTAGESVGLPPCAGGHSLLGIYAGGFRQFPTPGEVQVAGP